MLSMHWIALAMLSPAADRDCVGRIRLRRRRRQRGAVASGGEPVRAADPSFYPPRRQPDPWLRAISARQPWACAIIHAGKDCERAAGAHGSSDRRRWCSPTRDRSRSCGCADRWGCSEFSRRDQDRHQRRGVRGHCPDAPARQRGLRGRGQRAGASGRSGWQGRLSTGCPPGVGSRTPPQATSA